jgi:hypothetical protein
MARRMCGALERTKVVVGRCEHDGAVDFEQSLAGLVSFFYGSVFHFPNTFLGGRECDGEDRVEH